jgi:hypothetical protein
MVQDFKEKRNGSLSQRFCTQKNPKTESEPASRKIALKARKKYFCFFIFIIL